MHTTSQVVGLEVGFSVTGGSPDPPPRLSGRPDGKNVRAKRTSGAFLEPNLFYWVLNFRVFGMTWLRT